MPDESLTIKLLAGAEQLPPLSVEAVPAIFMFPVESSIQAIFVPEESLIRKSLPSGLPTSLCVREPFISRLPALSHIETLVPEES